MSLANLIVIASSALCFALLLSNAIAAEPERSRYGGMFFGTYAYDLQVGYHCDMTTSVSISD